MPKMNVKKSRIVVAEMMRDVTAAYVEEAKKLRSALEEVVRLYKEGEGTSEQVFEQAYMAASKALSN